jgi:hypothetical protein
VELIKVDAIICRYCGRDVQHTPAESPVVAPAAATVVTGVTAAPSRTAKIALGVVLVFGALFVLMIVIRLLV